MAALDMCANLHIHKSLTLLEVQLSGIYIFSFLDLVLHQTMLRAGWYQPSNSNSACSLSNFKMVIPSGGNCSDTEKSKPWYLTGEVYNLP